MAEGFAVFVEGLKDIPSAQDMHEARRRAARIATNDTATWARTRSQREIEREIHKLQMEEKKVLAEIKKLASQGQKVRLHTRAPAHANGATNRWLSAACGAQGPAKMMAKNGVRLRKQQEKLYKGRAQLSGVSQMTKSAAAQQTMMKGAAQTQL